MLGDKSKISGLDSATKSNLEGPTQEEQDEIESSYRAAEYYCMLATAIAGGVESPLQFIFQVRVMKFTIICISCNNFFKSIQIKTKILKCIL